MTLTVSAITAVSQSVSLSPKSQKGDPDSWHKPAYGFTPRNQLFTVLEPVMAKVPESQGTNMTFIGIYAWV